MLWIGQKGSGDPVPTCKGWRPNALGTELFGEEGQLLLRFPFCPGPQDQTPLYQVPEFCWSAWPLPRPLPRPLPHLEPHLLEEPTEVPLRTPGSQASCPNQQPLNHEDKACQEEIQAGFP